jgi:hypothetical protein
MIARVIRWFVSRLKVNDHEPRVVDEAEADFRAWSLVWDALKFNSATLQNQIDTYDRKATTLIAGGGVLLGLSLGFLSSKTSGNDPAIALLALSALLAIASEIVGAIGVMAPGLLEVPTIGTDQVAERPGPRDDVARNLVTLMSLTIAHSQPTYRRKRGSFQWQLGLFIAASISFVLLLLAVAAPNWPSQRTSHCQALTSQPTATASGSRYTVPAASAACSSPSPT